jgi:Flp pilus assembly protein TadD
MDESAERRESLQRDTMFWREQGILQFASGQWERAVESFRRWLACDPANAEAWCNVGAAYHQLREFALAEEAYRRALEIEPRYREAVVNLALLLTQSGRPEEGAELIRCFLASEAPCSRSLIAFGNACSALGSVDEAASAYDRALELNPTDVDARHNLGIVLHQLGRLDEAENCYRRVLQQNPMYSRSRANLGALALLRGDFARGWSEYEWRLRTGQLPVKEYGKPRWKGEAVEQTTVLVHAEQGLGDTIQFARYLKMVKEQGARIVFESQKALVKLLSDARARGTLGIEELVAEGNPLPGFDFHVPLLNLPGIFQTRLETIPAEVPYLFADEALVEEWREKLSAIEGFRIGINWHGRAGKRESRQRDVPMEMFERLARVPRVNLVSLQKEEAGSEGPRQDHGFAAVSSAALGFGEIDVEHGAFMDTAAIMMNLDLVITSDTSIAHLAGALGVPVWVALPFVSDWRWLLDRNDSPWYPTMRLFRQKKLGDWAGVLEEIEAALRQVSSQ